jgi:hypothetical protein
MVVARSPGIVQTVMALAAKVAASVKGWSTRHSRLQRLKGWRLRR